ncbi:uncharacterized protein LOC127834698 [Dreissena polymorpha]|uniref:Uncharacterized protein n=1 Tax=Dreissena polymorpha TaxID=45954 RepID=A0A9D4JPQ3_DREPO|nr:uncharacterized protein LOC127834698 [Dreissena polymorpha]KAH3815362.1 hypothetical protein DPMN_143884 [Dreissena polymorpha]
MDGNDTLISVTGEGARELTTQTARGKHDIQSVVMDGNDTLTSTTGEGVRELTTQTARGKHHIESVIMDGNATLISNTGEGVRELTTQTERGKHDVESIVMDGNDTLISNTGECEWELTAHTAREKFDIESVVMDGNNTLISTTIECVRKLTAQTARVKHDIESVVMDGKATLISHTGEGVRELTTQTARGKHHIESVVMDGNDTLISTTVEGVRELRAQTFIGRCVIQSDLKACKEEMLAQADIEKRKIRDLKANDDEFEYLKGKEMLQYMMVNYYDKTLSYVPTSALNNWVQARVVDIYMPPNLSLMVKDKDSGIFKKTATSIHQYSNMFLNDGKYNRNIFIQGEAGSGKSTFLAKLVMDWIQTTNSVKWIEMDYSNTADADTRVISANFFKDVTTLKEYTFVFHVTLRDSVNEFIILQMIKEQIIDQIWSDKKDYVQTTQ